MGRLIPKKHPKYDRTLDLDIVVRCEPAELFDRMWQEVHPTNVTLEARDVDGFSWSSVSNVGLKNLWGRAHFEPTAAGIRVTTRITRAHTFGWIKVFEIQVGPQQVRGIDAYREITTAWREALTQVTLA